MTLGNIRENGVGSQFVLPHQAVLTPIDGPTTFLFQHSAHAWCAPRAASSGPIRAAAVDHVVLQARSGLCGIPPFRLEPPKQHENDKDDKDEADDADATMPEAVAVAAKTATFVGKTMLPAPRGSLRYESLQGGECEFRLKWATQMAAADALQLSWR
jgi:hypothetical protein